MLCNCWSVLCLNKTADPTLFPNFFFQYFSTMGATCRCVNEAMLWGHLTHCHASRPESSELRLHRYCLSLRELVAKCHRL